VLDQTPGGWHHHRHHPTAPSALALHWSRSIGTAGRDPSEWVVVIVGIAQSNQEKGLKAVLAAHEANRVIDYYGLAPTANLPSRLPRSIRTGQPRDLSHARCSGSLRRIRTGLAEELARARSNKRRVTAAELVAGRALLLNSADVSARKATVQERKRVDA